MSFADIPMSFTDIPMLFDYPIPDAPIIDVVTVF
jgi:hypothetical protein